MKYIIDVPDGTKWVEAYYTVDHLQYQGDTIMIDSLIPYTESDRIREGDEVIYNSRTRAVVLKPETEEKYGTILTSEFATITVSHDDLEKTGRYFPEVVELLKKMRDTDED